MITIRKYKNGDEKILRNIFFNTIHKVNIKDYSLAQVRAWAPERYDKEEWAERIAKVNPFIAVIDNQIVGYADLQDSGYIDHFYCHSSFQGKGVGRALFETIHTTAKQKNILRLFSNVSITAKPFFERYGFVIVKKQQVTKRGEVLTNYVMEKIL